jgi:phenylacetate-CoA ligase
MIGCMTGEPTMLQKIYYMMEESQYWPPEQMRDFQRSQLVQLLRHARHHVPFYRERLDPVFRSNGDIDWSRWNEIPIVTRDDLRDRHDEMLADVMPPGHGPAKEFKTSGSTGTPLRVMATAIASAANQAAMLRFFMQQGVLGCVSATLTHIAPEGSSERKPYDVRSEPNWLLGGNVMRTNVGISRDLANEDKLDLLRERGVKFLIDVTNNAEVLARTNLKRAEPVRLDAVLGIGQGTTPEQRKLFAASFGARSISQYSSKEGGTMACQCSDSDRFHISSEILLLEILDERGLPCPPGARGRVVITPFFTTALPLIRYDQGDTAMFGAPCGCGSALPVMEGIGGRSDDLLELPNGLWNVGSAFIDALGITDFALGIQFAQKGPLDIELRYVPIAGKPVPETHITSMMRERFHPGINVSFSALESLPCNLGGKQQRVVRLFRSPESN